MLFLSKLVTLMKWWPYWAVYHPQEWRCYRLKNAIRFTVVFVFSPQMTLCSTWSRGWEWCQTPSFITSSHEPIDSISPVFTYFSAELKSQCKAIQLWHKDRTLRLCVITKMGGNMMFRFVNIKTFFFVYCSDKNLRFWLRQDEIRLLAVHTCPSCAWKSNTLMFCLHWLHALL